MCGIVGVRRFDGAPVTEGLLRSMAARLGHRGPDAEGYWSDGSVGFGHQRLSIIDVGGSPQPMAGAGGRRHLCFNGEILNYRRLRSELTYPYRTDGDTETLLAAYERYGLDAVHRLDGQFAFAMHDARTGELLLVRDRMGILPLYYYADREMIAFASEVKALLPALPRVPEVDERSLDAYLNLGSVPAPHTLFAGVRKLPAGHQLVADEAGAVRVERYWGIAEPTAAPPRQPEHAVDEVAAALRAAVSASLVADVPVGAYLSGGVDSSLIVALMRELRGRAGVETFAAGFGDPRHDELPVARRVSTLLGTRHHEVVVEPQDFADLWPRLTWHRDAPMSQPADFAVHRLAALAGEHVTVVLSGEGSDEIFAGYPKYSAARWIERLGVVPARLRGPIVRAVERRLPAAGARARIALRTLGEATTDERMRAWFAPFTGHERERLVGRWGRHAPGPLAGADDGDLVRRMLAVDCQTWLPDNLLERGDRMTMAASVELRPPFLDHHLVELAFSLPSDLKVRGGTGKWLVKEVARRYLPDEIVDRRKVGFRVPLDRWFRGGLQDMAWDMLTSSGSMAATFLDVAMVRELLERHRSGRSDEQARIWTLLSLEVWHDVFFRGAVEPVTVR